jgi:hypothetical protein
MRSSLIAAAIGFAVASFGVGGCAACTPIGCGRNSDCPTGQVCTASAQCSLAPDASAAGDDAGATIDASTADAPDDAAGARAAPEPVDRARYPRRHGRRQRTWRP